jgi:hypothetical protein
VYTSKLLSTGDGRSIHGWRMIYPLSERIADEVTATMCASAVPPLAAVKCFSQPHGQRDGFPPFEPEQSHLLVNQKGDSFVRHTKLSIGPLTRPHRLGFWFAQLFNPSL